jgi:hypothetical protein
LETQLLKFEVSCPKCGKGKEIGIPKSLFANKQFGTVKIKVPQGAVCEAHSFIVFITTKGKIVGYDLIDASISLEPTESTPTEDIKTSLDKLIDVFGFNCVAGFIHAKLFDYPTYIVRNEDLEVNLEDLNDLLDNSIPVKYKNDNAIKDVEFDSYVFPNADYFYNMVKFKQKNAFLINNRRLIIQVPWEIDNEFEKSILSSALERVNKADQLKYLAHYISQFINDVDFTTSLLENSGSINEKDLIKKLKEKLIVSTINKNRVLLIKKFLERRVSPEISSRIK